MDEYIPYSLFLKNLKYIILMKISAIQIAIKRDAQVQLAECKNRNYPKIQSKFDISSVCPFKWIVVAISCSITYSKCRLLI